MALPHAASMQQGDVIWSFSHTHTAQLLDAHAASHGYLHFHLALDTCTKRRRGEGGGGMECTARLTPYTDRYNKDE